MHLRHLQWLLVPLLFAAFFVPGGSTSAASQPAAHTLAADTPVTMSCPTGDGGDGLDRGFYVENFAGNRLDAVTLWYTAAEPGTVNVTLTARLGTYDGSVIGSVSESFAVDSGWTMHTFSFGGAAIPMGSTIAFSQSSATPFLYYNYGNGPIGTMTSDCPNFTQTPGTTPPLDSFRRDTVGVIIEGRIVEDGDTGAEPVPGCRVDLDIPSQAVGGLFVADASLYWAPGSLIMPQTTIEAGNTARVLGMDQSRQFYKIIWNCQKLWVPVSTMGPNPDAVWNSTPLPTTVVE